MPALIFLEKVGFCGFWRLKKGSMGTIWEHNRGTACVLLECSSSNLNGFRLL